LSHAAIVGNREASQRPSAGARVEGRIVAATTYLYSRARLTQSVWLAAGIGVAFIVVSALAQVLWFGIVIGLVCAASIVRALLQTGEKSPVLSIAKSICTR
jgi:hypothetical protein